MIGFTANALDLQNVFSAAQECADAVDACITVNLDSLRIVGSHPTRAVVYVFDVPAKDGVPGEIQIRRAAFEAFCRMLARFGGGDSIRVSLDGTKLRLSGEGRDIEIPCSSAGELFATEPLRNGSGGIDVAVKRIGATVYSNGARVSGETLRRIAGDLKGFFSGAPDDLFRMTLRFENVGGAQSFSVSCDRDGQRFDASAAAEIVGEPTIGSATFGISMRSVFAHVAKDESVEILFVAGRETWVSARGATFVVRPTISAVVGA